MISLCRNDPVLFLFFLLSRFTSSTEPTKARAPVERRQKQIKRGSLQRPQEELLSESNGDTNYEADQYKKSKIDKMGSDISPPKKLVVVPSSQFCLASFG